MFSVGSFCVTVTMLSGSGSNRFSLGIINLGESSVSEDLTFSGVNEICFVLVCRFRTVLELAL